MKKTLILSILVVVVVLGSALTMYEIAVVDNVIKPLTIIDSSNTTSNNNKNIIISKTSGNKIVPIQLVKTLLIQGTEGTAIINNEKYITTTIGNGDSETIARMPNAGEPLNIDKTFVKATIGINNIIGNKNAKFSATYNGINGWVISINGKKFEQGNKYTTTYIPKVIEMTDSTGYIYAPASTAVNQGFLIGYNLNSGNKFDSLISINYQNTNLPRKNALGLGNLILSGNHGVYTTKTGSMHTFDDTYTMFIQNKKYPNMKFIFNTGSSSNLEPLSNMKYYKQSLVKSSNVNDNIPIIYPITEATGYVYQKPTAVANGHIWLFSTGWNHGFSLNSSGLEIPTGDYAMPVYNSAKKIISVGDSLVSPVIDFNNLSNNPIKNTSGKEDLGITVKNIKGDLVGGQIFNVRNNLGKIIARNIESSPSKTIWLYGLEEGTYTITSAVNPSFSINETVIKGKKAPILNLDYNQGNISAPEVLNPKNGIITINLNNDATSVNLYKDGQYINNYKKDSDNQVVIQGLMNGLYTLSSVHNNIITSRKVEVGLNSSNENVSTSITNDDTILRGNVYVQTLKRGAGVNISLSDSSGKTIESSKTNSSGAVEFMRLPFGKYVVSDNGSEQDISISNSNLSETINLN